MKTIIGALLSVVLCATGCSSTTKSVRANGGTTTLTGTFIKEDGTPASGVRVSIFEIDKNGRPKTYAAVATPTSRGTMELIFQCPGTGVTDESGKLVANVDLSKFTTDERRFTFVALYEDPLRPNIAKPLSFRAEKQDSASQMRIEDANLNLDNTVGRIVVSGM